MYKLDLSHKGPLNIGTPMKKRLKKIHLMDGSYVNPSGQPHSYSSSHLRYRPDPKNFDSGETKLILDFEDRDQTITDL